MDLKTLNECICMAKQNEERFLALIKVTSDVIYSVSPDWKTMKALYGHGFLADTKEPDSNWFDKYIYPEDRKLMFNLIQTSIMKKETFEFEHRVVQADGNIGWVFSRAVPILDENGDIKEWFGAASDITERKTAEIEKERLRKSISNQLARMQALMDSLPVSVWICDADGKLEMTNKAVVRIYGNNIPLIEKTEEYERYMTLWSDTGEKIPVERFPLVRATSGETVRNMIVDYKHVGGMMGTEIISAVPIYDENENITGAVAAAMDITELRETREALRESEAKFRTVLENSMDGISLFNIKTGKYDYINPAYAKAAGFTLEDMGKLCIGKWNELIHPEDLPGALQALGASKKNGAAEVEYRRRIKGGEYHWFNTRLKSVLNADGEPTHIVIISRDITKRKQAEQELEKTKKHALDLVKKLEEADKNKDKFISVLSHELRNPLAAILAGVQMLDITQDADLVTKSKEVIKRQTNKLCRLVDDLLELTRITRNKINLKKKNIDLNETVKNAAGDIIHEYERKGVKLEIKVQTEPIFLDADPLRIAQTVENILSNALKFTQENGTVRLTLKKEKNYAVINIKDNGIGIGPEILPHLFTPFTQADDTLDRSNGGLGLGLSIVKGIVDLHGGTVNAHSDGLGKGSTFTIRLPITACQ